jgi:hypothetical protein
MASGLFVLVLAWAWLAVEHGTPRLWNVVVHESGDYTLGQTILYFKHFLREIPTLVAMALFAAASFCGLQREPAHADGGRGFRVVGTVATLGAAAIAVLAFAAEGGADGWPAAVRNFLQYYTRDDVSAYGSHWRFHWLSTLWFAAAVSLAAQVWSRMTGIAVDTASRRPWQIAAWAWFLGLTLVFRPTLEPFTDPRFIGHQAREILTHGLVTLPLVIAVMCLFSGSNDERPRSQAAGDRTMLALTAFAFVAIPVFLGISAIVGDAMSAGQTDSGLSAMVAAHFFEHLLDYVFVASLCAGFAGLTTARPRRTLA